MNVDCNSIFLEHGALGAVNRSGDGKLTGYQIIEGLHAMLRGLTREARREALATGWHASICILERSLSCLLSNDRRMRIDKALS